tara:strand:+ start:141 stop:491 length:351 start_codon:yes stop_codon:yes gene_type:complete
MKELRTLYCDILNRYGIDPADWELVMTGRSHQNLHGQFRSRDHKVMIHNHDPFTLVHEVAHLLIHVQWKGRGFHIPSHGREYKNKLQLLIDLYRARLVAGSTQYQVIVMAEEYTVI